MLLVALGARRTCLVSMNITYSTMFPNSVAAIFDPDPNWGFWIICGIGLACVVFNLIGVFGTKEIAWSAARRAFLVPVGFGVVILANVVWHRSCRNSEVVPIIRDAIIPEPSARNGVRLEQCSIPHGRDLEYPCGIVRCEAIQSLPRIEGLTAVESEAGALIWMMGGRPAEIERKGQNLILRGVSPVQGLWIARMGPFDPMKIVNIETIPAFGQ